MVIMTIWQVEISSEKIHVTVRHGHHPHSSRRYFFQVHLLFRQCPISWSTCHCDLRSDISSRLNRKEYSAWKHYVLLLSDNEFHDNVSKCVSLLIKPNNYLICYCGRQWKMVCLANYFLYISANRKITCAKVHQLITQDDMNDMLQNLFQSSVNTDYNWSLNVIYCPEKWQKACFCTPVAGLIKTDYWHISSGVKQLLGRHQRLHMGQTILFQIPKQIFQDL